MRRYLLAFAVIPLAAVSFRAVAQGRSAAVSSAASSPSQQPSSLAGIQTDKAVSIVAANLAPRALSVDSAASIFLTNAAAPNRVFALTGLSALAVSGSAPQDARLGLAAGNGVAGSLGDGGNALAAQLKVRTDSLFLRSGIVVAPDGTMFIADTLNSTIRRVAGSDSAEPGVIRSIAGRWAAPKSVQLAEPLGLALDRAGDLYVADRTSGAVDLLPSAVASLPGQQEIQLLAHVARAASLALTSDGRKLFVASPDTGAVVALDTQTRNIQSVPGFPARSVTPEGASKSICATARASESSEPTAICPSGIAVDGAANLFVADANSGRILRLDGQTSRLTTAASGLRTPGAMAFDNDGNLYVAEQGADRILKFTSMGSDPANLTITPPAALPAPPAPRVCPQTTPFDFCDQPVGGSTPTQAFTVTNNTTTAVSGLTISFTGSNTADFQNASTTCGTSLSAGASCAVNVDFAPTATGTRSANLAAADSAGDSATAALSGTGDDFELALDGGQQEQAVIQGGTLTYKFNVVPDAVFGGAVAIVCPGNLPSLTTCTPSASTVSVTPGTPASFSITFQTTYNGVTGGFPGNGLLLPFRAPRGGPPTIPPTFLWGALIFLASLALFTFFLARDRARPLVSRRLASARTVFTIGFCLVVSGVALLAGCKHHSVPANLNTPPGSTTMTIHGSAQNAGRGITIILDVTGRG